MNENKRLLALLIGVVVIIMVILIICFWPKPDKTFACGVKADKDYNKLGAVTYKQFECLMKEDEKIALVTKKDLSKDEKKALNDTAKAMDKGIYYIDTKSKDDYDKIKDDLKDFKENSLLLIEKNKITDKLEDKLNDNKEISNFLEDAGFSKWSYGAKPEKDYENIAKIDYSTFEKLYNSDKTFTIMVTQSTCGYCEKFIPVINEYAGKHNIPIYVLEIDTMGKDDANKAISSISYFSEHSDWGTPTTLAIKDKKVVASLSGYTDSTSELDDFFKEAGLE